MQGLNMLKSLHPHCSCVHDETAEPLALYYMDLLLLLREGQVLGVLAAVPLAGAPHHFPHRNWLLLRWESREGKGAVKHKFSTRRNSIFPNIAG